MATPEGELRMACITIIVVVFNGKETLENTIKSVVNFKNSNVEFIIIDGGSQDGTRSIIEKYERFITIWKSEPDKGIYDAMNKGWSLAKNNSYVLFLGTGDILLSLPSNLKADYSLIYYGDVQIGKKFFRSTQNFKLRLGNTLHHQALLIPKALHKEPPFNLSYKIYADFDFNQRLLRRKVVFQRHNNFTAFALPGGLSSKKNDWEMVSIVNKNFGLGTALLAFCYYKLQKILGKFQ